MDYSNFSINRKQSQQICFAIIADIEKYVEEHQVEFEEFLTKENSERKGGEKNE